MFDYYLMVHDFCTSCLSNNAKILYSCTYKINLTLNLPALRSTHKKIHSKTFTLKGYKKIDNNN